MRNRTSVLGLLLVGTAGISISATSAAAAQTVQASRFYDIPAQPLGSALSSYAEITGIDLVFSPAAVRGKRSHAVRGNLTPEAALAKLLRDSSLVYRTGAGGSIVVEPRGRFVLASVADSAAEADMQPSVPAPPEDSAAAGTPADAAEDTDAEEIIVTGIRGSLQRARDIKRSSSGVVDAVSAEDIGKFPDTNLAESLQRIPGVSIERRNGEGKGVSVRGFGPQFNLVTVNGRQLATSDVDAVGGDQNVDFTRATSRSFDFSNLASEGVSRLEVFKTGRAAVPSGGIGATINIVTLRPLDGAQSGIRGSIGAKALYDTSLEDFKVTPEISGVLGWSNDADTFGASIFGAYQKRESAAASSTVNDWNIAPFSSMPGRGPETVINNPPSDPNQLVAIPNDSRYHYSESSRERINGQATVQFRPMETLTLTADAFYAQNKLDEQRSDQTNWFNRPFDTVTFDDDPVVATAIYLDEGDRFSTKDIGFEQQYRATKSDLQSYGLNANWELTEFLTLNLDGNHSRSKSVPDAGNGASSTLVSFGAPVVDAHSVDFSGAIPQQEWVLNDCNTVDHDDNPATPSQVRGNCNNMLDIGDLGTQVQRTNASRQSHRINQVRADLGWNFGSDGRFDVGATFIDSKMESRRIQTQQQLGDWGITNVGDVQQIAGDMVNQFCMQCRFDRYDPTGSQVAFRGNAVDLYEAFADYYAERGNPINVTGSDFDRVQEKIWSIYSQLTWGGDLLGRRAGLVAGIRWENTQVDAFAEFNQPDAIVWAADNDFNRILRLVPETLVEREGTGDYNNFLPSVDFRFEPMDDVVARVSYSKTLARPDYGNLFVSEAANAPNRPTALAGVATGTTGNPDLKPLVSDNLDFSLEWYYDRSSYVSAGFFAKKVKNFVGIGQIEQNLFGLRDPSAAAPGTRSGIALQQLTDLGVTISDVTLFTMTALLIENNGSIDAATQQFLANYNNGQLSQAFVDQVLARTDVTALADDPLFNFSVATPINTENANIHGLELQGQHFFGDSGFGVSGSLTKVFGDVTFDRGSDPGSNVFALVGLSDTFNVTGIFERYGLSARLAYNWRGRFLSQLNRGGSRNPVYFEPFGTLDTSISYDVTPRVAITFEGSNLLSEPIRTYARSKRQLYFAQELKPRFWLGTRFKF